jgi:hypothetical protein
VLRRRLVVVVDEGKAGLGEEESQEKVNAFVGKSEVSG